MERAKFLIENDEASFVLSFQNKILITDKSIGVKPIITVIDKSPNLIQNADIADKIIGKAAALLLCKYKVKSVFANVISDPACGVFKKYNIDFSYNQKVTNIRNRSDTDLCPLEKSVIHIDDFDEAETAIRACIKVLMNKNVK